MDQAEFWQKQAAIQTNLAGAVIRSIPEDWYEAELILGPLVFEGRSESMSHELRNLRLTSGMISAIPDDEIYIHTRELERLFREFGSAWAQATLRVNWEETDEQWQFVMDFEYDD